MVIKKESVYFSLSLIFAIWFALTAYAWTYLANLFISFPFGLLSLFLWKKGRNTDPNKRRYRFIPVLLATGSLLSLAVLIWYLIYE